MSSKILYIFFESKVLELRIFLHQSPLYYISVSLCFISKLDFDVLMPDVAYGNP